MSTQFPYDGGYGGGSGGPGEQELHEAVGAYVLGVLDDADASVFEAHLAGCRRCAAHLEEFSGLEPLLATLADPRDLGAGSFAQPAMPPGRGPLPGLAAVPQPRSEPTAPQPAMLDQLLDEVAVRRRRRSRRGLYLVAAAAALVIGGPLTVLAVSDDPGAPPPAASGSPAKDAFFGQMDEKVRATDVTSKVTATVGLEKKAWGTHTVLELKNVKGPLRCSLVAVGKDGEEETVTTWAVPKWGYGIPDSANAAAKEPLYVHGGAAMAPADIERFEVRTLDGARLVEIDA
ncbi:anti-sigma factor family protein [Streptomyces sp. NPDC060194]|uniref:anti-sigma factor family protein n=1 Tax=Streptomyces sp. NPDC060194 TaxID=3347069 RepID=UPI0036569427